MLIYSRAIPEGEQEPLQWPENVVVRAPPFPFILSSVPTTRTAPSLQRDVQRHNQVFLRQVTQGAGTTSETVEVSVPSSTSVSGFTTPLEIPVTPGEPMDVSN